ncbi:MAG: hypothetical protein QG635_2285 [Bacteroidota bacterium]|nr:hypothetical protein [Bacteroidota bacterium]
MTIISNIFEKPDFMRIFAIENNIIVNKEKIFAKKS